MVPRPGAWWRNAYSRDERLWLAAIVAVAVAVRVGWVVLAARRALMGDPVAYTYHAAQLARGQGYRSFVAAYTTRTPPERSGSFPPTAFYPIGYPAALAVVFWLVFHTPLPDNLPRAVGFFQVGLGVGSVLLAAEVARHLFGSRVALYAAIMAVFPSLVYYTAEAHLETLFNFLVLAAGPDHRLGTVARAWAATDCCSSVSCSGSRRSCGPSRCSCCPACSSCGC